MPKYEFAIFNGKVRVALKSGEPHPGFEESWADTHYIEVIAPGEQMARAKIDKLYPAKRGFVVEQVIEVMEDDS